MITKYQAQIENEYIRGLRNSARQTTTYLGLSIVDLDDSGTLPANAEPSTEIGYARVAITNNSTNWVVDTDDNTTIENLQTVSFNEFTGTPTGNALYIFESDSATVGEGNILYYAKLEPEIQLAKGLTISFNAGDIQFTRTNPTTNAIA